MNTAAHADRSVLSYGFPPHAVNQREPISSQQPATGTDTASYYRYRGRLAPSPTGKLHLGHARTFWTAQQRAVAARGTLVMRIEDLDRDRSRPEFVASIFEDLAWLGIRWQEGPDCGGPCAPYTQSARLATYQAALETLRRNGSIYPCKCSRQDIQRSVSAPHPEDDEPVYPGTCRPGAPGAPESPPDLDPLRPYQHQQRWNWRFRVPDGRPLQFDDSGFGPQTLIAGVDFGDFVVWRHDGIPSYQLAVVVDDAAMGITEVVRGADLLRSTARQLLLYEAFGWSVPRFHHCPLMTDAEGRRLAKRHASLSLAALRERGVTPDRILNSWAGDGAASAGLDAILD